jgi:Prokaryotic RING finger family 1
VSEGERRVAHMQPGEPSFRLALAGQSETGRACPYCRFALKEGVQIAVCAVCGASHHADCWHDNGGCAVTACAGGPSTGGPSAGVPRGGWAGAPGGPSAVVAGHAEEAAGVPTMPTVAQPVAAGQGTWPATPPAGPPWPSQPPTAARWSPSLAIAVIVLAIAVTGAAVAIWLSQGGKGTRPIANTIGVQTVTASPTSASPPTSSPTAQSTTAGGTTASAQGLLPAVPAAQMQSEIQQMLLEWHEDVVHGNFSAAWELLSRRKRAQDSSEYGYPKWVKNQSTLRPYLDPAGLRVTIQRTEPSSGVAQVDLTGMTWNKPNSYCGEWSGITWVKYEEEAWRYDPGYSTTPQREREWKPRFSELLGGRC